MSWCWRQSFWIWVLLVPIGCLTLFAGTAARAFEDEYESGTTFVTETTADGTTVVYENNKMVFRGTSTEARDYIADRKQAAREEYLIPNLVIALGALTIVTGLALAWRTRPRKMDIAPRRR